mmetsp:Transcript_1761/g.2331  ORF Transcript_1761/g.2331 Transcript_1761/m.2331 type:complete len:686 (+) Transcript_1761:191-2248(+)
MVLKKIFSVSNIATCITVFYLYGSLRGIYNLMHPMNNIDLTAFPSNQLVKPYWDTKDANSNTSLSMKVYLSTHKEFNADFIFDEANRKYQQSKMSDNNSEDNDELESYDEKENDSMPKKQFPKHDSILLWEESNISPSIPTFIKSFILTTTTNKQSLVSSVQEQAQKEKYSESFQYALGCLKEANAKDLRLKDNSGSSTASDVTALLSNAGDGIETTSIILSSYKGIENTLLKVLKAIGKDESSDKDGTSDTNNISADEIIVLPISKSSSIWKHLMKNSTAYVHAILERNNIHAEEQQHYQTRTVESSVNRRSLYQKTLSRLQKLESSYNLLSGGTNLVKHDLPNHISKPKRFLYKDIIYVIQKYIFMNNNANNNIIPWDMSKVKPQEYKIYQHTLEQKESGIGYPYWKPDVAVKLVSDHEHYPLDYVGYSGMKVIRVPHGRSSSDSNQEKKFESGYAYLPGLYVDEIGLTSEQYIPLNETVDTLPLRISFESGLDGCGEKDDDASCKIGTSNIIGGNGLSPGRWRLLSLLSDRLESQKDLGFDQSDIDDVRRLVADTNVTLLGITVLASTLHLLFEFLTFKTDVEFWRGNTDLTGLSVRALFMDFFSQFIILLFLIEKDSSLLTTIPSAAGCLIALWKCQKGAGFKFVSTTKDKTLDRPLSLWNIFFVYLVMNYMPHAYVLRLY